MRTPEESGDESGNVPAPTGTHNKITHQSGGGGDAVNQMMAWDWKTDVAEYVPGAGGAFINGACNGCGGCNGFNGCNGCNGGSNGCNGSGGACNGCDGCNGACSGACNGCDGCNGAACAGCIGPMGPMWPMQAMVANPTQGWQVIQVPINGSTGQLQSAPVDPQEVQQLRAEYQWQARRQEEEMASLQGHLESLERQRSEMKEQWEREKKALTAEIGRYQAVLMTYAIPLEEAKSLSQEECNGDLDQMDGMQASVMDQQHEPETEQAMLQQQLMQQLQIQHPSWDGSQVFAQDLPAFGAACTDQGETESSSLHEKLRRLNGLLSEDSTRGLQQGSEKKDAEGSNNGSDGLGAKSIASTLQAMFPNATVRTSGNSKTNGSDGLQKFENGSGSKYKDMGTSGDRESGSMADPMVRKMAIGLEQETGSEIDDRAMMSLKNLPVRLALEALQKVDDLVQSQGGQCRNLSSILQSVCRKLERWSSGEKDGILLTGDKRMDTRNGGYSGTVADGGAAYELKAKRNCADAEQNGKPKDDDDDGPVVNGQEYWTQKRVERMAESGVELRQEGDQWRLRISLAGLDPPLPESGMGRFCAWLRKKLANFRTEQGPKSLRQCQGDIDFSNNDLSNESLWMLLESLTQFEVQASILKLSENRISSAGMLALGEFIRNCKGAGPVHELHLQNNEIDDDSALELLRTLKELQPRYPARRHVEGGQALHLVPVWVRLSQNRIQDPAALLSTLQAEGATHCAPRTLDAGCGTGCCIRKKCPLLHLYQFQDQVLPKKPAAIANGSPAEGQERAVNGTESSGVKKKKNTNKADQES